MQAPPVLNFIVKFMNEPDFRLSVLRAEMKAMADFGLTETQALRLRSMDSTEITKLLIEEAKIAGADIVKTKNIMLRNEPCGTITTFTTPSPEQTTFHAPAAMAEAAMYEEGRIHLHCVDAGPASGTIEMWIRGHGLGVAPEFEFRLENTSTKTAGTLLSNVEVGNDLFQRVRVSANLTTGKWRIFGRNSANEDFDVMTATPILPVNIP